MAEGRCVVYKGADVSCVSWLAFSGGDCGHRRVCRDGCCCVHQRLRYALCKVQRRCLSYIKASGQALHEWLRTVLGYRFGDLILHKFVGKLTFQPLLQRKLLRSLDRRCACGRRSGTGKRLAQPSATIRAQARHQAFLQTACSQRSHATNGGCRAQRRHQAKPGRAKRKTCHHRQDLLQEVRLGQTRIWVDSQLTAMSQSKRVQAVHLARGHVDEHGVTTTPTACKMVSKNGEAHVFNPSSPRRSASPRRRLWLLQTRF